MTKFFGPGKVAAAFIVALVLGLTPAARAQEPTQAQLDAARAAIAALHATDDFDVILPNAAAALKHSLIQAEPNLHAQINSAVDAQALKLAVRRGDLETQAAAIYAKAFTVDELKAIADFFNSEPGKKLLKEQPEVGRQLYQAAHIWSNGVARDLAKATQKDLEATLGKKIDTQNPQSDAAAPQPDAAVPQPDTAKP